jgi:hypothetical protein
LLQNVDVGFSLVVVLVSSIKIIAQLSTLYHFVCCDVTAARDCCVTRINKQKAQAQQTAASAPNNNHQYELQRIEEQHKNTHYNALAMELIKKFA